MIKSGFFFLGLLLAPSLVCASVRINEIMYDLEGTDESREWVEIFNDSTAEINLLDWKFNDGDNATNHGLNEPPKNGGQGSLIIPAGDYAIFAANAIAFLSEHLNYTSMVIDTVMSLNNTGATLKLINNEGTEIDFVAYDKNMGAIGDGNSLQNVNGAWVAQAPTPGAANSGATNPPSSQQQAQSPSQSSSGGSSSPTYIPPEKLPKIKADAGADKTVVVGANVEFRGQAFGLKDEPIDNARFLWTFGDGATKEGKNITHIYRYPGDYAVVLDITSGDYSASDRVLIKATANQLFISEVKIEPESSAGGGTSPASSGVNWIEFENKSKQEIDISGSQIRANGKVFTFPQSSRIFSGAYLVIPSEVSGLALSQGKGVIEFLYSGGFKADIFNYGGILKDGQSFNRDGALSFISNETPGGKNSSNVNNYSSTNKNPLPNTKEQKIEKQKVVSEDLSEKEIEQDSKINADANAGAINLTSSNNHSKTYFIIAILAVIIFGVAAILFIRRHRGV